MGGSFCARIDLKISCGKNVIVGSSMLLSLSSGEEYASRKHSS